MLPRLRNLVRSIREHPGRRTVGAAFGAVFLLAVVAACESTNTYPVDFFTEMHYQKSYRTVEPPRFGSPDTLVPVSGRFPQYTQQELVNVENPVEADEASIEFGQALYTANCATCHGETGEGNGPMLQYFENAAGRPPANLREQRLVDQPDGYIHSVVTYGLGQYMPPFGDLIPGQDIWHLVNYVRVLQEQQ